MDIDDIFYDVDDFMNDDSQYTEHKPVECKFCGQRGLTWVKTAAKWELRGHRGVHVCHGVKTQSSFDVEDAE